MRLTGNTWIQSYSKAFPCLHLHQEKWGKDYFHTCLPQNIWSPLDLKTEVRQDFLLQSMDISTSDPTLSTHSYISFSLFLPPNLLELFFILELGKKREKGTEAVKFHLSPLVPSCLELPCWLDFTHKNVRFWSSAVCSLILWVHFFQQRIDAVAG